MSRARRVAGALLVVAGLSACSSGASPSASSAATGAGSPTASGSAAVSTAAAADTASTATATVAGGPVATDGPRPRTTDVVLSFLGWNGTTAAVDAGGYVSPAVESGGTCTLALTRSARTITATAPGEPDASTTVCGDLSVPRAELAPGSWTAVLRYASPTSTGSSEPMTVEVPQ